MPRPSQPHWFEQPNNIWWRAYKLWSSSLCSFIQPPVTLSLLGPNNLSTLFSNITLYYSLVVTDKVSHQYKTTGGIIGLILYFFKLGKAIPLTLAIWSKYNRFLDEVILFTFIVYRSRGSSGSIVSDYGLDDRAIEVRSPTGADFSSSPCVQTGGPPSLLSNGYRG
jgi:hypothetical protein